MPILPRFERSGGARGRLFGDDDICAQRQVRTMRFGRADREDQGASRGLIQQITQLEPGVMGEEMIGHKTILPISFLANVRSRAPGSLGLRRRLSGNFAQIEGIDGLSVAKDKQFIAFEIESDESGAPG